MRLVPPSGGSLEIGNPTRVGVALDSAALKVPPSGGSLEIGNAMDSLEDPVTEKFPLRGDP